MSRKIIHSVQLAWLMCMINFINALDAMMVNPLFPLIAKYYKIPDAYVGYGSGIYLFSAFFSGLIMFFYLAKLSKRKLLLINLIAITILSLATAYLNNFYYFLLVRFFSGIFGGFTFSVVMSIILNQTLIKLRSKIIAIVMTSYALISLLGLPFITFLASFISFRAPFIFVAFVSLILFIFSYFYLEDNLRDPLQKQREKINYKFVLAASSMGISQFGSALLIPILVPIFIYILNIPITQVPLIFLLGGIASFSATHITRFLVKKFSINLVIIVFTTIFILNILTLILSNPNAYVFMFIYMYSAFARTVAITTFASFFSKSEQFDQYSTLQTNVLNLTNLLAFILPSLILQGKTIHLDNIFSILIISIATIMILPLYFAFLKKLASS